jgi:hypothetical protein
MFYLIALRQRWVVIFIGGIQILVTQITEGQDLSSIDKKNPVKISGGINATQTLYKAWEIERRRDPYYWLFNANLNFDILGISIPFSAIFSQQNKSFTQPFNSYGLSPRYKSITAHIGYRSLQFSTFTLAGTIFLGGGIEVAPAKSIFRFSAMHGRFSKAISVQEAEGIISGQPAFERWGYGSKLSIGNKSRTVDLIVFHAKDIHSSIPRAVADSFQLKPAENLVLGINTKQSIGKRINLDIEYAFSSYTQDITIEGSELKSYKAINNLGPVFTSNISSQFNNALNASLSYTDKLFQFRASYRRIDPEFKTMGSAFLNNDLEDISGNLSWRMYKNKINISAGAGLQRNNLSNELLCRMNRFLGSVNLSYLVNKKLNVFASYSNFTSSTRTNNTRISANQLGLIQNPDSLAYDQITNSANGGINYNTGTQNIRHVFFSNAAYQKANDNHQNGSVFYNTTSGYQLGLLSAGLNINFSASFNNSIIKDGDSKSLGPNLTISKLLFKKALRSSIGVTLLRTYNNGNISGTSYMIRFSNSLKKGKHHHISMDLSYLMRDVKTNISKPFSEARANLIYGFTF